VNRSATNRAPSALLAATAGGVVCLVAFSRDPTVGSFALVAGVYGIVGWLVARRHPHNRVGWLLLVFAAVAGVMGYAAAAERALRAFALPGGDVAAWTNTWMWAPIVGTAAALLPLFPDGRLLSRRSRAVLWLAGTFTVLAIVGNGLHPDNVVAGRPNPFGLESMAGMLNALRDLAGIALLGALVGGIAALITRYRRNAGVQRRQLKWFLAAAAFLPVAIVVGEQADQRLQPVVMPLAFALLGVAIGIAILRHGLYDIDRIISRTVAYGVLTVALGGIYLVAVTTLTALTSPVTGDSPLAVAAATLLAAAAFQPLRRRIQGSVDRRFNRGHYDAVREVEAYRGRLRDELELEAIGESLVQAASATVQPSHTALWLRSPQGVRS